MFPARVGSPALPGHLEFTMQMRLKNVTTNKEHDIVYDGDDIYLDGVPAIINGKVTSYYEEIKRTRRNTRDLDPDKYDLFSMYDVDDNVMFADIKELMAMDRGLLVRWVRENRAQKYINIYRAKLSIIKDILDLKKKVLERNFIEVNK
jgi:hypothetical protein